MLYVFSIMYGCGLCTKVCVTHNIRLKDKKAETILNNCILCGQCTQFAPKKQFQLMDTICGKLKEKKKHV